MTPEQKTWIDNSSYEGLLQRWRNTPVGDSIFQGDAGTYYQKVMTEKRNVNPGGAVQASKNIGW